jgi:hypothetical protein
VAGVTELNHMAKFMSEFLIRIQKEGVTAQNSQIALMRSLHNHMISEIRQEFESTRNVIQMTATNTTMNDRVLRSIDAHLVSLQEGLERLNITSDLKDISNSCRALLNTTNIILSQKSRETLHEIRFPAHQMANSNKIQITDGHGPSHNSHGKRRLDDSHQEQDKRPHKSRRRFIGSSVTTTWFGKILTSSEGEYLGTNLRYTVTEIMLLPANWLWKSRVAFQILRYQSAAARESPRYSLKPVEMLPRNSPILLAIAAGDTSTATTIFSQRDVSPFEFTADGENLLEIIAEKIYWLFYNIYLKNSRDVVIRRQKLHGRLKMPFLEDRVTEVEEVAEAKEPAEVVEETEFKKRTDAEKKASSGQQEVCKPHYTNPVSVAEEYLYTGRRNPQIGEPDCGLEGLFMSLLKYGVDPAHRSGKGE